MLLGKKQQMWINKFKIAIVQKDTDTMEKLLENVPSFENIDEAKEASYLMQGALELLFGLQDEIIASKKQIKNNIRFLQSSLSDSTGSFSIKS